MRQPKPFYRKQTKTWYVQIGKQQINLGGDREKAWQKYCELMSGRQVVETTSTFVTVSLQFLEWCRRNKSSSTHGFYKRHLVSFSKFVGEQQAVSDLRPYHVTQWLDATYPNGGDNHRRNAIRSIQRALNWAVSEGYFSFHPLAKMKKPPAVARDEIFTAEHWKALEEKLSANETKGAAALLEILTMMRQTGCRPLEARTVEARHFDQTNQCIVFERVESKGKLERRVIPLTDKAFELCQRNAERFPEGPIFRNYYGRPWTKNSLKKRMYEIGQELGIRTFCYAIRHTWATEALERGVDPITVATILGHKDVTQLMKTYQHINKKAQHLRSAMHKATTPTPALAAQ